MKYDILFYKSRKTSYCEKSLKRRFKKIDMSSNRVIASTAPETLGEALCKSLTLCNLVVIVGGFSQNDSENLVTVLSRVISSAGLTLDNVRKLKGNTTDGYIIKYENQMILALPDDPNEISSLLSDTFLEYLKSVQS